MVVATWLAVLLVLSNVALLPAIFYAYFRRLFVETTLLVAVLVASTAFHFCQVGWFCFGVDLHALQITDHFMVYTALVWFSLYFAGAAERTRMAITIGTMAVMLPVILTFIGSWLSGGIIISIVLVLTVIVLTYVVLMHGGPPVAWSAFVVAMVLLALGVFLHVFGGDFGPKNWKYPVAHSVWHVMAMLSLYYIIGIPFRYESALNGASRGRTRAGKKTKKRKNRSSNITVEISMDDLDTTTRTKPPKRSSRQGRHIPVKNNHVPDGPIFI